MKKCPFCAEDIQDAAVKCRHCGEAVAARPATQRRESTGNDDVPFGDGGRKDHSVGKAILLLLRIAGVALLGLGAYSVFGEGRYLEGLALLVAAVVFVLLAGVAWSVGNFVRQFVMPDMYFVRGGTKALFKARLFWMYGPQSAAVAIWVGICFMGAAGVMAALGVDAKASAKQPAMATANSTAAAPPMQAPPPQSSPQAQPQSEPSGSADTSQEAALTLTTESPAVPDATWEQETMASSVLTPAALPAPATATGDNQARLEEERVAAEAAERERRERAMTGLWILNLNGKRWAELRVGFDWRRGSGRQDGKIALEGRIVGDEFPEYQGITWFAEGPPGGVFEGTANGDRLRYDVLKVTFTGEDTLEATVQNLSTGRSAVVSGKKAGSS